MSQASTPTPAQIQTVQANLKNMQALNDYVYNHGQSKILNAYALLNEQQGSDPGLIIGLNILEGAFWAIGGSLGPIGNFAASFLSGMVAWWATTTPPSLGGTFSNLITRFNATSIQVDSNLATYSADVPGNWNTSFTYNGNTTTIADLSTSNFPAETDPAFFPIANAALFALDQYIWTFVLKSNFKVTYWSSSSGDYIPYSVISDPASWAAGFYAVHPAYYTTWTRVQTSGCGGQNGWNMPQYSLGGSTSMFCDNTISNAACQYLFIDSVPGTTINPAGLFTRATVFTGLGIPTATQYVNTGGGGPFLAEPQPRQLSTAYLRAMKEGNTLTELIKTKGRDHVQQEVLAKAASDSIFARDLVLRPHQTLEAFLGVKIAEVIDINVYAEGPRSFTVVLPQPDGPGSTPAS